MSSHFNSLIPSSSPSPASAAAGAAMPTVKLEPSMPTVKLQPFSNTLATAIAVEPAEPGWSFNNNTSYTAPVRGLDDVEGVVSIKLYCLEDKAIILYVSAVCKSLPRSRHAADVLDTIRLQYYGEQRKCVLAGEDVYDCSDIVTDLHGFVDYINFATLRVLVKIRRELPRMRDVQLMQLLLNSETRSRFAKLVNELLSTIRVESTERYINADIAHSASDRVSQDLYFWSSLTGPLACDTTMTVGETYYFEKGYHPPAHPRITNFKPVSQRAARAATTMAQVVPFADTDAFVKPTRPFMFLMRLILQAMNNYSYEKLQLCFDAMKVQPGTRVDATKGCLLEEVSRDPPIARAFSDALIAVCDGVVALSRGAGKSAFASFNGMTLLTWLQSNIDGLVYFAHLAGTHGNLFVATRTLGSDSRKVLVKSLEMLANELKWEVVVMIMGFERDVLPSLISGSA